ncbi:MAG: PorT family protein [Bacteroides sp.]|nr:PorT family protein [Bacteroides sp.]
MKRGLFLIGWCLLLFSTSVCGQNPVVPGTPEPERPQHRHLHDRPVNFGVKGGFTSSLFLVSNFILNDVKIDEVQNNYKIGYFGSLFMRVNFGRHFLQPEISYTVNRCNIAFERPQAEDTPEGNIPEMASITSSLHSFEVTVIYGYNFIKEGPYSLAVFGGPKIRYIWDKKSEVTFENFGQQEIEEDLYPFNLSFTTGVAVTISRIFFDFRYDIGLHNISRRVRYKPAPAGSLGEEGDAVPITRIRFHRRDNVFSFSLGVFF